MKIPDGSAVQIRQKTASLKPFEIAFRAVPTGLIMPIIPG
jgi:hypothetical protein